MSRPRTALIAATTSLAIALPGCGGSGDSTLSPEEARYAKEYEAFCRTFVEKTKAASKEFDLSGLDERQSVARLKRVSTEFLDIALTGFARMTRVPAPKSLGDDYPAKVRADYRTAETAVSGLRSRVERASTLPEAIQALEGFKRLDDEFGSGQATLPDKYEHAAPSCAGLD